MKGNVKPFRRAGVLRSFETKRVAVSDITINGNRKAQRMRTKRDRYGRYGFFSELTNYLYLRRVGVINNLDYWFDPHGSKKYWAYYLLLEDCFAKNNGLDGFTLDQTFYIGIKGAVAAENGRHSNNIATCSRYVVAAKNVMRGNGFDSDVGCGMMAQNKQNFGTFGAKFIENSVRDSRKSGLCRNASATCKLCATPSATCTQIQAPHKEAISGARPAEADVLDTSHRLPDPRLRGAGKHRGRAFRAVRGVLGRAARDAGVLPAALFCG